jgi:hypothetical protein
MTELVMGHPRNTRAGRTVAETMTKAWSPLSAFPLRRTGAECSSVVEVGRAAALGERVDHRTKASLEISALGIRDPER